MHGYRSAAHRGALPRLLPAGFSGGRRTHVSVACVPPQRRGRLRRAVPLLRGGPVSPPCTYRGTTHGTAAPRPRRKGMPPSQRHPNGTLGRGSPGAVIHPTLEITSVQREESPWVCGVSSTPSAASLGRSRDLSLTLGYLICQMVTILPSRRPGRVWAEAALKLRVRWLSAPSHL